MGPLHNTELEHEDTKTVPENVEIDSINTDCARILIPLFNPKNVNTLEWKVQHCLNQLHSQGLSDKVVLVAALRRSPRHVNRRLFSLLALWEPYVFAVRVYVYQTAMFFKEQLLSLGVQWLYQCVSACQRKCVVWLDGDILFAHQDWLKRVVYSLLHEEHDIVQAYHTCYHLNPQETKLDIHRKNYMKRTIGIGAAKGHKFADGDTGLAWAARMSFLSSLAYFGFHPGCIVGGYDRQLTEMMDCPMQRFGVSIKSSGPPSVVGLREHLAETVAADIRNYAPRFGYATNIIQALYHGKAGHRRYRTRYHTLAEQGYDPRTDLMLNFLKYDTLATFRPETYAYKPRLVEWVHGYFSLRNESLGDIQWSPPLSPAESCVFPPVHGKENANDDTQCSDRSLWRPALPRTLRQNPDVYKFACQKISVPPDIYLNAPDYHSLRYDSGVQLLQPRQVTQRRIGYLFLFVCLLAVLIFFITCMTQQLLGKNTGDNCCRGNITYYPHGLKKSEKEKSADETVL